ncbi:MAG: thymidine phosphorylase [bacterium]|nr:thymidine phosphorylase [bacterium]
MYEVISKKRDGGTLSPEEIQYFIDGYVAGDIPDYQAAAMLMAVFIRGMNPRELADFTRIMMLSGDQISLEGIAGKHLDKHSTGGVGDKISFVVSPLVAACGVNVPMLSGRALGHTGGTLDKLEAIPGMNCFLDTNLFKKVLADVGIVISGQTENVVPADRKLYALRDTTATVESIPLISASIMSKKLALGTDGLVLDVKTGSGAFMVKLEDSIELCKTMVEIGLQSNRTTIGLITDMDQPLGRAVGNSLEIIESIETLKGNGPDDILAVSFALGAAMLVASGKEAHYPSALSRMHQALESGKPLEIFRQCIAAQEGNPDVCDDYSLLPKSKIVAELPAEADGYVTAINAYEVGMTAVDIGAGRRKKDDVISHGTGFMFHKKVGDKVCKGESILSIHADTPEQLAAAEKRLQKAVTIAPGEVKANDIILYIVDKKGMREWPREWSTISK